MRIVADVNALAIHLADDHPGNPHITEVLTPAFLGEDTLVSFGYQPFRVQWVLEEMGVDTIDARNAVRSLLKYPMHSADVSTDIVLEAYEISAEKNHDAFDSFYIALARQENADKLVTTDRDFADLCNGESFDYENPVPESVLTKFHAIE